jgi:hypothetical protein
MSGDLVKFWRSGKLIAVYCMLESAFKLAFSISDLVLGHFSDAAPDEMRGEVDEVV